MRPGTTVGDHSRINGAPRVRGRGAVTIGRYCAIGRELLVIAQNHDTTRANVQIALDKALGLDEPLRPRPVSIGNAVWIGDRVTVLAGAVIGDGAVVGAGSVVTSSGVPPFTVAAGVPARPVRARFASEMAAFLADLAWWEWPRDRVLRNAAFLSADLTELNVEEARGLVV
jgi:virginiamycin A acetyltransferase